MKNLRQLLLTAFAMMALVAIAQQTDPVITSIKDAYKQAKVSMKQNKGMGNEMVTTLNYTVRGKGKTTETPHFFYYPLYFVTRSYNIGKQKYYEEYLFNPSSQRLLFALTQDYDENGKRFDRRFYFHNGSVYSVDGPGITSFMKEHVYYQAEELRLAFDWLIRNPKE